MESPSKEQNEASESEGLVGGGGLSVRCTRGGYTGNDEVLIVITKTKGTTEGVRVRESFLLETFPRAAGGTNIHLMDQEGHRYFPRHEPDSRRRGDCFFELPRRELCYELLFDEKDLSKNTRGAAEGLPGVEQKKATAPPAAPVLLDLSDGEHGDGGDRMYVASNGVRVISSALAADSFGIANLFSRSKKVFFCCHSNATPSVARGAHLTIEFPWKLHVAKLVVRSKRMVHDPHRPDHLHQDLRSNYSVLGWDGQLESWMEIVPMVDTTAHPVDGVETAHVIGREVDRLRIYLTSDGEDAGVILGKISVMYQKMQFF